MPLFPQAIISGFHKHFLARCVTAFRVLLATVCALRKRCPLETKVGCEGKAMCQRWSFFPDILILISQVAALWTATYHTYRSVDLTDGFITVCLKIGRGEIYIDLYINIVGYTYFLRAGRRYKVGELFPLLRSLLWKHFHRPNNTEWRVCISQKATTLPPTQTQNTHADQQTFACTQT